MPHQEALTIVAKVEPHRVPALEDVMTGLRANPGHNELLPFASFPGCHFGRVLFLPASFDLHDNPVAPQLLMMTDCDGSARDHLESVVNVAGKGIDALFEHCEGYPRCPPSRSERLRFLRRKTLKTSANYVHRPGRTVEQIRGEAHLREALRALVQDQSTEGLPALEVRTRVRAFLKRSPELRWSLDAPPGLGLRFKVENAIHAASLPLGLLAFGPVVVPAIALLLALVRMQEAHDRSDHIKPTAEHARQLEELEDFAAHGGFTAGGYAKPGWVRQAVLATVLPLIGYGTRHLFSRDSLAGIKTIHFARWIPLDEGRRVVFASNYDGSLESYNNDFIDLIAWGLNLVFSNGNGYPKTRWLLFGGASREQEFKDYLRRHQIPTPVWYSAYPELTAVNIERNAKLRAGLSGRMTEREARQWLRLL